MAKFRETASSSLEICQILPFSWQFYNQIWVICHVTKKIKTNHFFWVFLKGKLSGLHQASRTQQELLFWFSSYQSVNFDLRTTQFGSSQWDRVCRSAFFKKNEVLAWYDTFWKFVKYFLNRS